MAVLCQVYVQDIGKTRFAIERFRAAVVWLRRMTPIGQRIHFTDKQGNIAVSRMQELPHTDTIVVIVGTLTVVCSHLSHKPLPQQAHRHKSNLAPRLAKLSSKDKQPLYICPTR